MSAICLPDDFRPPVPKEMPMVQSIIQIARTLGLQSVAEGVKDTGTAEILRNLGGDALHGHDFGKPMPRAEFIAWLSTEQPTKVSHVHRQR